MASIPRKDFLKKGMKKMECYKEISFVAAMGLQVFQRTEDVFFREKGSLDMFSLAEADLDDIVLSTAIEATWFVKENNPTNRTTISG